MNLKVLIGVCIWFAVPSWAASEIRETKKMSEVFEDIEVKVKKFGAENILVAFDLDSTLLSLNQDLGSDYWFAWQSEKIKNNDSLHRVATQISELFDIQLQLYTLSQMHPPEPEIPELVKKYQASLVPMMVLTSRALGFRDVTEKALMNNGFEMFKTEPKVTFDQSADFAPYSSSEPEKAGLTAEDISRVGLKPPNQVSYSHGVYLSAGNDKGVSLKSFLLKMRTQKVKAIVFVDDRSRHCVSVKDAFEKSDLDVVAFRYGAKDDVVSKFEESDKANVIVDYEKFDRLRKEVFKRSE